MLCGMSFVVFGFCLFFFQAEDGIRDIGVTGADVCSSDDQHVIRADLPGEGPIDADRALEAELAVELRAAAEERVQRAIRWCVCSILHESPLQILRRSSGTASVGEWYARLRQRTVANSSQSRVWASGLNFSRGSCFR